MSLPTSLAAYRDCVELFEAATRDPKGARVKLDDYDRCVNTRTRMHYYRNLDRRANALTYEQGHPLHNASAYDDFVLRIRLDQDGKYWLYIEPRTAGGFHIEGLSEVGEDVDENGAPNGQA